MTSLALAMKTQWEPKKFFLISAHAGLLRGLVENDHLSKIVFSVFSSKKYSHHWQASK